MHDHEALVVKARDTVCETSESKGSLPLVMVRVTACDGQADEIQLPLLVS